MFKNIKKLNEKVQQLCKYRWVYGAFIFVREKKISSTNNTIVRNIVLDFENFTQKEINQNLMYAPSTQEGSIILLNLVLLNMNLVAFVMTFVKLEICQQENTTTVWEQLEDQERLKSGSNQRNKDD